MQRLFFSLKFSPTQQQQLLSYQQQAQQLCPAAKAVNGDNLHLTLFFLGQVDKVQRQRLIEAAQQINVAKPKILYLAPSIIPASLRTLQHQVASLCKAEGFIEMYDSYRPHITLARHGVSQAELQQVVAPLTLRVEQFALYHSTQQQEQLRYLPQTVFNLI
jgi:RNA 2',3'-cyclic 3'-phosphodiesterase